MTAVAADLLLEVATDFVDHVQDACDEVERIEHGGGVVEFVFDGAIR